MNRVLNPAEKAVTMTMETLEAERLNKSIQDSEENKSPSKSCPRKPFLVAKRGNKKLPRNVLVPLQPQSEVASTDSMLMKYVEADIRSCPPPLLADNPYSLPVTDPRGNPDYDKILDEATANANSFMYTELDIASGVARRPPPLTPAILYDQSVSDHQVIAEVISSIENAAPVEKDPNNGGKGEVKQYKRKATSLDTSDILNAFIVQDQIMNESNSIY